MDTCLERIELFPGLLSAPCSLSNLQSQASKDIRFRCYEKLCLEKSLKLPRTVEEHLSPNRREKKP